MKFVKVIDKGENKGEVIDLNVSLILKVEKQEDDYFLARAKITDVLGNKYQSMASYDDFFIEVYGSDAEMLKDLETLKRVRSVVRNDR